MVRNRILDVHNIRESVRDLIKRIKKTNRPDEKIVLLTFLKEIDREIYSYLLSTGHKVKDSRSKK